MTVEIRELWDIGSASFQAMVAARLEERGPRLPGDGAALNELVALMLGDEMIPDPDTVHMRAVEIGAGADVVWSWMRQMMRGGGMYGWSRLESSRIRSAAYLIGDVSDPASGDAIGDVLEIAAVAPGKEIVWKNRKPLSILGLEISHLTFDYLLRPRHLNSCRLVVRQRARMPRSTQAVSNRIGALLFFLLPGSQIVAIKECAERADVVGRNGRLHQAIPFRPARRMSAP